MGFFLVLILLILYSHASEHNVIEQQEYSKTYIKGNKWPLFDATYIAVSISNREGNAEDYSEPIWFVSYMITTNSKPVNFPPLNSELVEFPYHKPEVKVHYADDPKVQVLPPISSSDFLPLLPFEPYQRIMTFAIEHLMIPNLWYLEVIHCMFISMAPYFKGMLGYYSLQVIIGASMMSLSTAYETFGTHICMDTLKYAQDDNISENYKKICNQAYSCLKSHPFKSGPYSRFSREFQSRINKAYSLFSLKYLKYKIVENKFHNMANGEFLSYMNTSARFFLVMSIATVKSFIKKRIIVPSMLFYSIKLFNLLLAYTFISIVFGLDLTHDEIFNVCSQALSYRTRNHDVFFLADNCIASFTMFQKNKGFDIPSGLIKILCYSIFVIGFINGDIIGFDRSYLPVLNQYISPIRVTSDEYAAIIPSFDPNSETLLSNNLWLSSNLGYRDYVHYVPDSENIFHALTRSIKRQKFVGNTDPSLSVVTKTKSRLKEVIVNSLDHSKKRFSKMMWKSITKSVAKTNKLRSNYNVEEAFDDQVLE